MGNRHLVYPSALIEQQEKFDQAATLFCAIVEEAEIRGDETAVRNLAKIGRDLTHNAARAVGDLIDQSPLAKDGAEARVVAKQSMDEDERDQLVRDARAMGALTMGLATGRERFFVAVGDAHQDAFYDMLRVLAEKVEAGVEALCVQAGAKEVSHG